MTHTDCPYGFRVVGSVTEPRRLVNAAAAFAGHCAVDALSQPDRECYLSAFQFGSDFSDHHRRFGTPKGFAGPCWSPWLWIDIDRDDPENAAKDARRLVGFILERYRRLDEDELLVQFTGKKGYLIGVPLAHDPPPSVTFNTVCRKLAEGLSAGAGVRIDPSIYVRVQPLRAPNSFHPKGCRHKRRVTTAELMGLTAERIAELAREPAPFAAPAPSGLAPELASDWDEADELVTQQIASRAGRPHHGRLKRDTTEFLRNGAEIGERRPRLFQAAADMAELANVQGIEALIHALLTEPGLDCGVKPSDVQRQIQCGIECGKRMRATSPERGAA